MKFSLAATALCALSSASAAAVPVNDPRAVTVVGTIDGSVNTVKNTLPTYLSNIGMLLLNNSTQKPMEIESSKKVY